MGSYRALIYSAVNNAMRGVLPSQSAAVDAESIAETLFPIVSQAVCEAAAANLYKRSLVRREFDITLVAGEATVDPSVLTHYIADAVLIDPAAISKQYAWRDYPDFVRRNAQPLIQKRIGVFTLIGGDQLQVIEPNGSFTEPLTATGARTLVVPAVVERPADPDDDIDAPSEIISDLDEALANALRGQIIKEVGIAAS